MKSCTWLIYTSTKATTKYCRFFVFRYFGIKREKKSSKHFNTLFSIGGVFALPRCWARTRARSSDAWNLSKPQFCFKLFCRSVPRLIFDVWTFQVGKKRQAWVRIPPLWLVINSEWKCFSETQLNCLLFFIQKASFNFEVPAWRDNLRQNQFLRQLSCCRCRCKEETNFRRILIFNHPGWKGRRDNWR